jgi:hypothetical protein
MIKMKPESTGWQGRVKIKYPRACVENHVFCAADKTLCQRRLPGFFHQRPKSNVSLSPSKFILFSPVISHFVEVLIFFPTKSKRLQSVE